MSLHPTKGLLPEKRTSEKLFLAMFGLGGMFLLGWIGLGPVSGAETVPARAGEAKLPSFQEVCFEDFYLTQPWPEEKDLRALLSPAAGHEARIEQAHRHQERVCRLVGLWQWQPTWEPGLALRLSLVDMENFQIHVWAGQQGVSFRYYPEFHQSWAVFKTMRTGDQPRPETRELWATDQGSYRRTGLGTVALYYHEGRLTLVRGDVPLVSVPFPERPREVYFEGRALVRGLAMFSVSDGPPTAFPKAPLAGNGPPAMPIELPRLAWQNAGLEKARLRVLDGGVMEWSADPKSGDVHTWASVVPAGMYEWTFQVDTPQPGTGIFWANAQGEPQARLSFFRDRRSGRTTFGLTPGWHREVERHYEERRPTPWIEGPRWFRLVHGAGVVKLFISPDGATWTQAEPEEVRIGQPLTQIGLFCWDGEAARMVRLRHLAVRRLVALESLVPEEVRRKVAAVVEKTDPNSPESVAKAENPEQWESRVMACRPAEVPASLWRRAWIVHGLLVGPIPGWGPQLLYSLVREAMDETADLEKALALLEEAAWVFPAASDWQAADQWAGCYERLGRRAEDFGQVNVVAALWRSFAGTSFWPQRDWPPVLERLIWYELIRAMSEHRWPDAAELCRRLRFRARSEMLSRRNPPWSPPIEHLICMAEDRCAGRRLWTTPDRPIAQQTDYRPPLLEQWAREAYNVKTEWEAALANGQFREACVILSGVGRSALEGVLPDPQDADLLSSLQAVVVQAMEQTPALRQTMREEFGPRGQVRLRQAIQAGNAEAVELIAVQFAGTQAAVEARQHLGDRALAAGRFAEAAGHYRQALAQADPPQKPNLQARLQLALALQGQASSEPLAAALILGGSGATESVASLRVENFPQWLEDLVRVRSALRNGGAIVDRRVCPPPPSIEGGRCAVRQVLVAEGGSKKPDFVSSGELDWAGRETASVLADPLLIIASRCEHLAFDMSGARQVWRHWRHIPSAARPWPLLAPSPVLVRDHLLVRRAIDGIHELVCLDRNSGNLLWSTAGDDYIAGDALWADQAVWVFTVRTVEGQKSILSLLRLDPTTGRIQRRFPLLEFRSYSEPIVWCQAALQDDRIVGVGAGVVFCCDLGGRMGWARRQTWVPPPGRSMYDARLWLLRKASSPVIHDRWVYVTQPGVWNIECLDLHTGRLRWRTTLSELVGLEGLLQGKLIASTQEGFVALDPQSGQVLWRHDTPGRMEGFLCGEPGGILYAKLQPAPDPNREAPKIFLVWIDPRQGQALGQYEVEFPAESKPLLGPLLSDGVRLWAFHGKADDSARRVVFEVLLRPDADASQSKKE